MKKIFIALFLFITSSIFSQELLGEFQSSSSKVKNLFYKIDREGKRLALFTTDSKNIYGYYLNNEFKIEYKLQVGKHRKFNTILGCITDNNGSYTIYLSNNNRTKFKSITLSFKNKTSNSTEFTLLREYETFLQSIIFKNKFYLLSSSIIANNSYLYSFDSGEPKRNIINVNNISFISKIGTQINLPDLLVKKIKLKKINTTIPNSIRLTADKRKMYVGEENIVFTFDNNSDYTQILTVNLNDYETSYKKIQKPLKMVKRKKKISNSYLLDKHLFTIAVSKKNLEFNIIDIEKNLTIKSYKV
ncbi:hypothetical protein [uncultured Tenacibaculum sp.]|uniref:hypothetical protein n=1 Tax=uncultured Tenacibaculum sp. TaxID=174713 RepID=UPI0026277C49|nr:hypothetical protein [uncultured Tenacibaculum sp.]